ncbi:hypothetical protein RJ639_035824 [Escallonia herrerae]|uniref:Protein kish n=1 Tax=Escallonia herrerae TaxID=1293975 RepID=A0AA88X1G8_9ASTE|nr:hypothetical protein RJ639_035824 [Escallonia herrerae]
MVNDFSADNLRYDFDFQIALWGVLVEQSALFNFHSFLTVVLLMICTCTFLKMQFPAILEQKTGFRGFFWKAARIDFEGPAFELEADSCFLVLPGCLGTSSAT